ncbi:glycosyltransferase [Anatilimnocola floriformis]|uniref:glycosyltransferase n=1 Tax=Anatilimnocola floriformis TaxID=2948575 RepID=UPI0020C2D63B|nr:glycosyltransferase [Anatilimnocola floriformis]
MRTSTPIAAKPELSIIVTTFQRPQHLQRVLTSIAAQRGHGVSFEVVVADDGSTDHTPDVVREFAQTADFPVHFTTAPHHGFRAAANRNRGAAASSASYLLFLDGDCLIPPDHLVKHLAARRAGIANTSYCVHLDQPSSESLGVAEVAAGKFTQLGTWRNRFKLWKDAQKSRLHFFLNHPNKPRLTSGNFALARTDFERINGFDESFVGWGCEDDDLGMRLRAAGIRVASILHQTHTYHLWHPKSPSVPKTWRDGANVAYLHRRGKLARCANGLVKRRRGDLQLHILESAALLLAAPGLAKSLQRYQVIAEPTAADVEIRLAGDGAFSKSASVKLLVVNHFTPALKSCRGADLILCDFEVPAEFAQRTWPLHALDIALESLLSRPEATEPRRAAA